MKELQELLDFLKSKGHHNTKIPIDLWVDIIEYFGQKSNYSSGSSETQAVRQNEKSQEVCLCDNPRTLECDDNKGPWCIKCEKYIYKQNE